MKRLITSALPYVNNVPHLGNIIGAVLSADVYARYCRAQGYPTRYICATDEYGTATENRAREEGLSPKEICDKYHQIHKEVYQAFNISFDFFGRTSHPEHIEVTQGIFNDLEAQGNVIEQVSEQTYCEHDKMFLADRYVEGVCPHCNYDGARGDQCDQCGKLLQTTELIEPKCKVCGQTPVRKTTNHLYIDLPKLGDKLNQFLDTSSKVGHWSTNASSTTQGWLDRGLMARPITRDLQWGVPVPKEGFESKVFYVWFDAPIGYISATKRGFPDDWQDWWLAPESTELYQFMAKDNIPFHTVVFPASLIGTGKNWTLLHHISSTEYLKYEGGKFSKSRNIGIFGNDVLKLKDKIAIDLWRFYLLYNRPEKSDANFTWEGFVEDVNSNFIDNIGNLLNRVLVFYHKNFTGPLGLVQDPKQTEFLKEIASLGKQALEELEAVHLREGLRQVLAIGRLGNKHFHDAAPWKLIKEDRSAAKEVLVTLSCLLVDVGRLLLPFMPETAERILAMFGQSDFDFAQVGEWGGLAEVTPGEPEILFKKLDPKEIVSLGEQFSGVRGLENEEQPVDPLEAWAKVEMKVGKIIEISLHPDAERLYVEKIDLGGGEIRTIVSGLVSYYQPEELLGKQVLVASNLKPATLRGVLSEGMVLAVQKRKKLEVLFLPEAPLGALATLQGEDPQLKTEQITIDEFFEAPVKAKDHQCQLGDVPLVVDGKLLQTVTLPNGNLG